MFPRTDWAFALLAALNAGLGLFGSWMLIGDFADGERRLTATILLLLTPFYTFLALKYNANSIFLSLWPWTMHFFVRSIDNRRLPDAILFGSFMGLAMLSKYFALIFAATCFVAALVHPARRAYFTSASPWVSFLVAAFLFAPHAWWLARSDALPVDYFMHKTGLGATTVVLSCVFLLAGVIAFQSIIIALIALTKRASPKDWLVALRARWLEPRFRVLMTLAVLPLALTLIAGLAFRLRPSTNMTIAIFSLMPLLFLELAGSKGDQRLYRISRALVVGITLTVLVLSPAIAIAKILFGTDINYVEPRKELAREATRIWHETTASPLLYVAGSQRYENAVAFYSTDRPHVFIHLDVDRAPWVTAEELDRARSWSFVPITTRCLSLRAPESPRSGTPDRIELGPFLLGLHCAAFELCHNRCAAPSVSSASPKRAIDFVRGAETFVPCQSLGTRTSCHAGSAVVGATPLILWGSSL